MIAVRHSIRASALPRSAIPSIEAFLKGSHQVRIGWGRKPSGERAVRLAARDGVPFLLLEDGFIRSVERDDAPLSVVADDRGIYYDCRHPSRLEHLVAQPLEECEERRAGALVQAWREERVSKYNHARDHAGWLPGRYVLVCDQTLGDQSVLHGGADAESFRRMLDAALEENPGCKVVLKIHPDVLLRRKRGYLDAAAAAGHPRIHVIAEDCHAASLIAGAEAVYAVTSQMGFEALIWGRRVRCFGMPFYAGWGLTADDCRPPARRAPARLEQLVHAALVRYPRYADPETGERCEVERVLAHVGLQRRMRGRFPPLVHALGFSRWKRPIVKRFLAGSAVVFVRHERQVPAGAAVALWGRDRSGACPQAAQEIAIEDGFLRSVGLGADFTQPLSWVQDDMGLHYDAAGASRLERILAEEHFSEALLARAAGLRAAILAAGITKYNLAAPEGGRPWRRPDAKGRVILVPGQVEDDAALRHGAPGVRRNADLLRAVRAMHPDGYIVYKPHPDVAAGLRAPGPGERDAASWCDEIAPEVPIGTIFDQVDEVHTMTSLAGFEALLRGRPVTCHGLPFYAGWGLTADMIAAPRRSRRLGLDELVAGALILYPSYVSRVTGRFTTPERALEELIAWRSAGGGRPSLGRRLLRPALAHARRLHRCLIHGG